jgi:hypothetical protein
MYKQNDLIDVNTVVREGNSVDFMADVLLTRLSTCVRLK